MSETFEELDAELVTATKKLTRATSEYALRYVNTNPIGYENIPIIPMVEVEEKTNEIKTAKERHHKAAQKSSEYRRTHPDKDK
ncbi:MAG: hypothetical protein Q8L08_08135 [Candidatus Nanopelagicaceae bacterium]|nr:hypothetical protein [Candidatus Nanopelagicaceae bacterium]